MHTQATIFEDDLKNFERKVKVGANRIKVFRHGSESIFKFDEEIV
jgi:hypothetical protein